MSEEGSLYETFGKDLYRADTNVVGLNLNSEIDPANIGSGGLVSEVTQDVGNIATGKADFSNTVAGYILGVEDGVGKFYIGDSTNYLNWTGTSLDISGALTAGSIDIGGSDATSFHVSADGNCWLGAATFATAPVRLGNNGTITLYGRLTGYDANDNWTFDLDPSTGTTLLSDATTSGGSYVLGITSNKLTGGGINTIKSSSSSHSGTSLNIQNHCGTGVAVQLDASDAAVTTTNIGIRIDWNSTSGTVSGSPICLVNKASAPTTNLESGCIANVGNVLQFYDSAWRTIYFSNGTDVAFADGGTGISSWTQYLIPYAATTTSIGQIAIGTSGQVLTSNGAGSAPTFQTLSSETTKLYTYSTVDTDLYFSNDDQKTYTGSTTLTKIKQITIPAGWVTKTIRFYFQCGLTESTHRRLSTSIKKSGVEVFGYTNEWGDSPTLNTHEDDITSVAAGDTIEVWAAPVDNTADHAAVSNMRILGTTIPTAHVLTDTDP
jgi:hypothetical protein